MIATVGFRSAIITLLICATAASMSAQGTSASITGTLKDATGAVITGAGTKATSVESGREWTSLSNEAGIYNLIALPPGSYTVTVEAKGFKRVATNTITLEVNQVARVDLTLEVGAVADTVAVTGVAPLLDTETTQLGSVVSGTTTVNLPLNGRNFSQLTLLAPGVVFFESDSFTNGQGNGGVNGASGRPLVNGNRAQADNFRLDGLDVNEAQDNLIAYYPSIDAIQEFKLITTNPPAEFGNSMGAIVNVTLKSGSNSFHGTVFEFLRNSKMDANSFFGDATGLPNPHFSQNIFGGAIGGPIRRNRLFFFTDYQGWRRGKGVTAAIRTVIPVAWRQGDFSSLSKQLYNPFTQVTNTAPDGTVSYVRQPFPNNQIPQSLINPVARNLFNYPNFYPTPLFNQNVNNWNGAGRQGLNNDQGDVKIDYRISDRDSLSGRFSISQRNFTQVDAEPVDALAPDTASTRSGVITWNHIFSPTMLNEARVGLNRYKDTTIVNDSGHVGNLAQAIGIPTINQYGPGLPAITFADATGIGNSNGLSLAVDNTFQYTESLTITRGRHIIKTGFELLRYQMNRFLGAYGLFGSFDFNGSYTQQIGVSNTGSGVADFLLGYPDNESRTIPTPWGQRQTRWGAFVQDDIKIKGNLTINIGLRYEYITPLVEVANRQANFNLITGVEEFAGVNGNSRGLYSDSKNGWQPRWGMAWTPNRTHGRLVVRTAYGILNYLESTGTNRRLPLNPPFQSNYFVQYDPFTLGRQISDGFPPVVPGGLPSGSLRDFPAVIKPAFIQEWNFTLEYRLPGDIVLSTGYVGEDATHLMMANRYYSQATLGTTPLQTRRRDYAVLPLATEIVVTDPRSKMNYQGFQNSLQKRFTSGLEFLVSYTWSHAMSDNAGYYSTSLGSTASPQNYGNLKPAWGPASMDVRHSYVTSANYELPFGHGKSFLPKAPGPVNAIIGGWRMSGVLTLRTGMPLTIIETPDTTNTGSSGPRPNLISNPGLGSAANPNQWFNTASFVRQAPNTFGNSGTGVARMPGIRNLDFSLEKQIPIVESKRLEFRAEVFNLTNTPLFSGVANTLGASNFGTITAAQASREIQLGLKFYF
jgi:hypothetical protein